MTEPVLRCDAGPNPRSGSLCTGATPIISFVLRRKICPDHTFVSALRLTDQVVGDVRHCTEQEFFI